jgi:flavin-dependent dehydrogenase
MDDATPVVVIGASVAGLFAAQQLVGLGVPVEVCERTERLEPRARTLIVTPELQRVLGFSPASATLNKVHTLELCTRTRTVPIALREPDLIVERSKFIEMLAARAERAGARLSYAQDFTAIQSDGAGSVVELRERGHDRTRHVPARAVVAADGVRSHVARSLGQTRRPAVTVLQARVATQPSSDPGVGKVWFLPRETQYFYWLCPESSEFAAVGLVDTNPRHARAKLDRFLAERNMEPIEYQSALVPLYTPNPRPSQRCSHTDVAFVGDAAGQVKVTTIGGTVSGLLGARAAVRAIAGGKNYLDELRELDRELRLHWRIRSLMNRFHEHEYDALLHLLSGKVGKLLAIHNRDRMATALWPIVAVQPRLPLLAAQVMLRVCFRPSSATG